MAEYSHEEHIFGPVFDKNSKILILGSFPSVKSRQEMFYYGHKQNRFWKVLTEVLGKKELDNINEKKNFLFKNNIALWDVIDSCDIVGSSDASIRNVVPVNLDRVLSVSDIKLIILNGTTAYKLYQKYLASKYDIPFVLLPSTSPANAKWSKDDLVTVWSEVILKYLF